MIPLGIVAAGRKPATPSGPAAFVDTKGGAGDYVSSSKTWAFDTQKSIIARVRLNNASPASGTLFGVHNGGTSGPSVRSNGTAWQLVWHDGTAFRSVTAAWATIGLANGVWSWLRVDIDRSATNQVRWYRVDDATDDWKAVAWGAAKVTNTLSWPFTATATPWAIGSLSGGGLPTQLACSRLVAITGAYATATTPDLDFYPARDALVGTKSWTSPIGETWTLNGTAEALAA